MKKIYLLILLSLFPFMSSSVFANEKLNCENRNLTIINPVRGRNLWGTKTLDPIINQYEVIKERNLDATWLLQYDAINDKDLSGFIKTMDQNQELGLFLEVSEDLALNSKVIYPHAVPWDDPGAVFLSGYSQSDRKKLVNTLFSKFKDEFGYYPASVGAWWIDSYSLDYMKDKYNIQAALIVADQLTTDDYGVWGQWWGVPYYPSDSNILVPSQNLDEKKDIVILQWAQRDPLLAFGEGPKFSNYSLQANDYLERGLDINFFKKLVATYLNCNLPIGQATVGLETGMEGYTYLGEYTKQLDYLHSLDGLRSITMSEFADVFANTYPEYPSEISVGNEDSTWFLSTKQRINQALGERQEYNTGVSFQDYFIADKASFLNRRLISLDDLNTTRKWVPWALLVIIISGVIAFRKEKIYLWLPSIALTVSMFGLLLRSHIQFGWKVYFGPVFDNLEAAQIIAYITSFLLIWGYYKLIKNKVELWILPLVSGLTSFIQLFRYAVFEGRHYFGIMPDSLKFIGVNFSKLADLHIINQDLPSVFAASMLGLTNQHFWGNGFLLMMIYVVINVIFACLFWKYKDIFPNNIKRITIICFIIIYIFHIMRIMSADPSYVLPI